MPFVVQSLFVDGLLALLPLQRDALRALLENGTRHLPLTVELELEERPARVPEAGLRARGQRGLRIGARLHDQRRPFAAERRRESRRRLVLTDIAIEDCRGQ